MTFQPPRPDSQPGAMPPAPDPVAVFQIDGVAEGWMRHEERRLSDLLNAGSPLRVRLPHRDGDPDEWLEVHPEKVVAVAPPPRQTPSPLRYPRRRQPFNLSAASYRIAGTAHMPPGADPVRFVRSPSRHWLPLTECIVELGDDAWAVEVVIVNLEHVSRADAGPAIPVG